MEDKKNPHEHPEEYIKPGNENYLSYYKSQKEWKPTRPLRRVAAMNTGPGPAIVCLPTSTGQKGHDPTKTRAPAYPIGFKPKEIEGKMYSCDPGPALYDIRKKTNKGEDICHAPKIGNLIDTWIPRETSPGPGKYNRATADKFVYRKSPAYTMGMNPKPLKKIVRPGPADYKLPPTLGPGRSPFQKSPCYTIRKKSSKTGILQLNPGPGKYMLPSPNLTMPKAPAYTMGAREGAPKTLEKAGIFSPGPASNDTHMVKINKPSSPRYTFGIRHSPYEAFQHFAAEK